MKNKVVIIFSVFILGIVMISVLLFLKNDNGDVQYTEDEVKFKDEYENLNGYELAEDYVLKNIDVEMDSNVDYVNDDEVLSLLNNGTNIIYFGWADCNWCRSIVPSLIETLKENSIDTLYYYDFKNLRTSYENNEDETKVKLYEDIIKIIGKEIESVFDENSPKSGEKKILAPTVVFIKNGEFLGLHVKSVDGQLNSTDELNDTQKEELKNIYKFYIDQINASVCIDEGC